MGAMDKQVLEACPCLFLAPTKGTDKVAHAPLSMAPRRVYITYHLLCNRVLIPINKKGRKPVGSFPFAFLYV